MSFAENYKKYLATQGMPEEMTMGGGDATPAVAKTRPPGTVSASSIMPATAPTAPAPATPTFAIPSTEERKAMVQNIKPRPNILSAMLYRKADEVRSKDPQLADEYVAAGDATQKKEGIAYDDQTARLSQKLAAREGLDRIRDAAFEYAKADYDNQDPSFADVAVKIPLVQNTIGVRRFNPYTMQFEHDLPRNFAEGLGALLTHVPEIAHAAVSGSNRLQEKNRATWENSKLAPFEADFKDMEAYRTGTMPEPPDTPSDELASMFAEVEKANQQRKAAIMQAGEASKLATDLYGKDIGDSVLLSQLGITKTDPTGSSAKQATMLADNVIAAAQSGEGFTPEESQALATQLTEFRYTLPPDSEAHQKVVSALNTLRLDRDYRQSLAGKKERIELPQEVIDETGKALADKMEDGSLTKEDLDEVKASDPYFLRRTRQLRELWPDMVNRFGRDEAVRRMKAEIERDPALMNPSDDWYRNSNWLSAPAGAASAYGGWKLGKAVAPFLKAIPKVGGVASAIAPWVGGIGGLTGGWYGADKAVNQFDWSSVQRAKQLQKAIADYIISTADAERELQNMIKDGNSQVSTSITGNI